MGRPENPSPYEDSDTITPERVRAQPNHHRNRNPGVASSRSNGPANATPRTSTGTTHTTVLPDFRSRQTVSVSDVSTQARSPLASHTSKTTVLGPAMLPPKPAIFGQVATAPPRATRVEKALVELEDAFDAENDVEPPASEASGLVARSRKRGRDESELPTGRNAPPRYGPLTIRSHVTDLSSDEDCVEELTQQQLDRRSSLQSNVDSAAEYWRLADAHHASNALVLVDKIPAAVLVLLRRGRRFMELIPLCGVNQATKKSRMSEAKKGRGFGGQKQEFETEALERNLAAMRMREQRQLRRRF